MFTSFLSTKYIYFVRQKNEMHARGVYFCAKTGSYYHHLKLITLHITHTKNLNKQV